MQKAFVFITLVLSIFACNNQPKETKPSLETIESQFEKDKSPENLDRLLTAYSEAIATHADDAEKNAGILFKASRHLTDLKRYSTASEYLQKILKEYFSSSFAANSAVALGDLYENQLNKPEQAMTVYQSMKNAFPTFQGLNEIAAKIPADSPTVIDRLQNIGSKMFDEDAGKIDYKIANNYLQNCELYAMMNPASEKSPELLAKGAEVARSIKSFNTALEIYQWIYGKFPNSKQAPQALFLEGFTLDNELHKQDEARKLYEAFLEKYPKDDFADDAKFLLDNLGKSEAELIKEFEAKQKK